jgi:hypothetical protein
MPGCEFVAAEEPFLLLRHKAAEPPRLTLLHEGEARPREPIDLSAYGESALWLEVDLTSSWSGWLEQLIWRPPTVRLATWGEPGHRLIFRHRAPPSMLSAGFLVSPLLRDTDEVFRLLTGAPVARPGACSIELLPGDEHYWKSTFHFRLFRIENRLGR